MIFEKSEKIVIVSNEDLENVVGGKDEDKNLLFKKFPDKIIDKSFYISGGCALVVALVGLSICTIGRVKKFFK